MINISNISQYAVIVQKSVPIDQKIYTERADFLPENWQHQFIQ